MYKILITIQGKTLILFYQIKHAKQQSSSRFSAFITITPDEELSRFDLKGLTPEMFCMNIADSVNIQGVFNGVVENERQISVARWSMNRDEFQEAIRQSRNNLSHRQIVQLLSLMPAFVQETNNQYIDFEECVIAHTSTETYTCSGYKLTIMTEDIEGKIFTYAYFSLDTRTEHGWLNQLPSPSDLEVLRNAVNNKLQLIKEAGVTITRIHDDTDYMLTR